MSVEQVSKKRLLLIQPVPANKDTISKGAIGGRFYPLGLLTLDALTPKQEWDVEIVDEGRKRLDMSKINIKTLSLIGINSWTNQAPRAYEIARAFREQGVPVIMGGPHPSALPQEALRYADSICIGEGESVWTKILADARNGSLQEIYQGERVSLDRVPILRHPLRDKYLCGSIQTARGCPNNCDFCSVTATNGARIRYRPIPAVVEELRHIKQRLVFVADDNFIGSGWRGRTRALNLCKAMVEADIHKFWATQATHNLGREDELLEWMYKAGCRLVLFGLESINEQVLDDMHKGINTIEDYKKHIQNTQRHGIAVVASFVFGNDADSFSDDPDFPDAFRDTIRFIEKSKAAAQNFNIICPLPGTKLFNQVYPTERLRHTNFPEDWAKYTFKEVVLQPKNGSPLDLYTKRREAERRLNNKRVLVKRTLRTLRETRSPIAAVMALVWNMGGGLRMRDYRDQIKLLEEEMEMTASNAVS